MRDDEVKPEIVHASEYITVWYHPEAKVVHHKVHKSLRGEDYRRAFLKGAEILQRHGAQKWLSDVRLHFILPQADQEWANDVWFPATLQAGWKYCAVVRPEMAIVDLYVHRFAKSWGARGVTSAFFDTPDEGLLWLRGIGEKPVDSR